VTTSESDFINSASQICFVNIILVILDTWTTALLEGVHGVCMYASSELYCENFE
jgi:hypothetical protein